MRISDWSSDVCSSDLRFTVRSMEGRRRGWLRRRARDLTSPLGIADFRRLWVADMISTLGEWAGRLALAVLVLHSTGSLGSASAFTPASRAGFVGIGPDLAP